MIKGANCPLTHNKTTVPSKDRIFEFYLFINPLGGHCYRCEKEVLSYIENSPYKVHVHFVAFHNFKSVTQYMRHMHLNEKDIDLRNDIYMKIYDATLSYKAALLQGKKLGRAFLMELQTQLHQEQRPYSPELLDEILTTVGIDKIMFYEDKASALVKKECEKDQEIAREMFVEQNPSLVIFDNTNQHYGVLIKECITADTIAKVCDHNQNQSNQRTLTQHLKCSPQKQCQIIKMMR